MKKQEYHLDELLVFNLQLISLVASLLKFGAALSGRLQSLILPSKQDILIVNEQYFKAKISSSKRFWASGSAMLWLTRCFCTTSSCLTRLWFCRLSALY